MQLLAPLRQVAVAAMAAEDGGIIAFFKEMAGVGKAIVEAEKSDNQLVASLAAMNLDDHLPSDKGSSDRAQEIARALELVPPALELLRTKATEDDARAYGAWLVEIAVKISEAAKSGGVKISDNEQEFIDQLTEVVKG
ncbi:hypothetical protein GCM10022225_72460 [Plantactinospora mayteni]|uniref:TerB family tellurite resistance protein n=1 Tax=Plantactinospora mayteni TaxID=566021 RepID=A0ABQ4F1A0_9ACTN|nr:hypothetical protein Pma05_72730 [Plantactinospora mayteni]